MKFDIIIRGHDCPKEFDLCLARLIKQTYPDWRAFVFLDDPTDAMHEVIESRFDERIFVVDYTKEKLGPARMMWFALDKLNHIKSIGTNNIVAILDADDFLHKRALEIVNKVYEKHPTTLITHGSYIKTTTGKRTKVSRAYPKGADVRKYPWRASHFKTFDADFLPLIKEDWFKDKKGNWLTCASDVALMIPLVEIAGLSRVRFIVNPIYYWTGGKCNREEQKRYEAIIRSKPKQERLGGL